MITILPIPFRRQRKPPKVVAPAPPPPPPPGPVLSAVDLDAEELQMSLEFADFEIELDSFDPATITLNDPNTGAMYQAASAEVISGFIVGIVLTNTGASSGTQTLLNVAPASGIVDAATALAWVGCANLVLPFP